MNTDLLAALIIGLLGSSHCLVMCGGIAAALQLSMPSQSPLQKLRLQLLLSLGRLTTYSLFGAAVGLSPVLTVIPPFPTSNRGGQDEFTLMESGIPQPAWGHAEADA